MNPLTQSKDTTILPVLIAVTLACFALPPQVRATCKQGCLVNGNTVLGDDALVNNTSGTNNTAIGSNALEFNTTGANNTATGQAALFNNTTGSNNTADGVNALVTNTTGLNNTANGFEALQNNTTGQDNTAIGVQALLNNTIGGDNTAIGYFALFSNTADDNTATGLEALEFNTTGTSNTATGNQVLQFNTTGNFNTATGDLALTNNTTGSNNIALGSSAGVNLTTGSNNIDIGNAGVAGDTKRIRIGTTGTQTKTFIAGISGATVASGVGVIVGSNGQLGTVVSSARFKEAIRPMDKASEAILALKPVTFHYKHELDPAGTVQFGLIAEQVEKVNPDLVARDEQGKPYTVRYEAVNAMLLNEFLKKHKAFVEEQRKVQELEAEVASLIATVKKQASQIQNVSAQLATGRVSVAAATGLEMSGRSPQMVVNNQ